MLFLLPNKMKEIPLDRLFPYDENNLCIAVNPRYLFVLKNIQTDEEVTFSIKAIVSEAKYKDVFGDELFEDRLRNFEKVLFSKLERFFVTKKDRYLFFDEIEQEKIKSLMDSYALMSSVEMYEIADNMITKIDFNKIGLAEYNSIKKYLRTLGAVFLSRPDDFFGMIMKCRHIDRDVDEKFKSHKVDRKLREFFLKYESLIKSKSKADVDNIYRDLSKKLHPDKVDTGDSESFADLSSDFNYIKKTRWYKGLR